MKNERVLQLVSWLVGVFIFFPFTLTCLLFPVAANSELREATETRPGLIVALSGIGLFVIAFVISRPLVSFLRRRTGRFATRLFLASSAWITAFVLNISGMVMGYLVAVGQRQIWYSIAFAVVGEFILFALLWPWTFFSRATLEGAR